MQCRHEQSTVLLNDGTFLSITNKKLTPRKVAVNEIVFQTCENDRQPYMVTARPYQHTRVMQKQMYKRAPFATKHTYTPGYEVNGTEFCGSEA